MQRILSVYDWQHLPAGSQFSVSSDIEHQRSVRLRVNAPFPMALFINQAEFEQPILLAHVVGLDEIQFEILGDYQVMADGGDVYFDTLDGTKPFVESVDNESFTQIVERRVRNPELELIERRMQENMERRMGMLAYEIAEANRQRDEALAAARPVDTPAVAGGTDPVKSETAPVSPAPATPADEAAAGTTAGETNAAS